MQKGTSILFCIKAVGVTTGFSLVVLCLLMLSCSPRPLKTSSLPKQPQYLKPVASIPPLYDDLRLKNLGFAIEKNIERLKAIKAEKGLPFGETHVDVGAYILALEYLRKFLKEGTSEEEFFRMVSEKFDFYEVARANQKRGVLVTSYYEPVINGSRVKTDLLSQPVYRLPDDLVRVNLYRFTGTPKDSPYVKELFGFRNGYLVGRLEKEEFGGYILVPYYDREQIDREKKLEGKNLEIAWVEPIDAFFLHIQGSGTIRFKDGTSMRIGYAGQNGHPYRSIGRYLSSVISDEEMSLQSIRNYLRAIPYVDMRNILFKNPSYVFFRVLSGKPVTSFGTEVVDGRTIATDPNYYPKGALAFMQFEIPVFEDKHSIKPSRWISVSRFVLDQDTGGAIRGPYRVDLFWGSGKEAERYAGVMKRYGRLFYLVPKKDFIEKLYEK